MRMARLLWGDREVARLADPRPGETREEAYERALRMIVAKDGRGAVAIADAALQLWAEDPDA